MSWSKILIKNGRIWDGSEFQEGSVRIEKGIVTEIGNVSNDKVDYEILGKMLGGSMQLSMDSSIFIMGYICLASITSYCLWNTVVKDGELSKLFIIKFAEPAFACVFGALILREDIFQLQYLIAFLLIAGGIVVVTGEKGY